MEIRVHEKSITHRNSFVSILCISRLFFYDSRVYRLNVSNNNNFII